jgi:hypothetical protein
MSVAVVSHWTLLLAPFLTVVGTHSFFLRGWRGQTHCLFIPFSFKTRSLVFAVHGSDWVGCLRDGLGVFFFFRGKGVRNRFAFSSKKSQHFERGLGVTVPFLVLDQQSSFYPSANDKVEESTEGNFEVPRVYVRPSCVSLFLRNIFFCFFRDCPQSSGGLMKSDINLWGFQGELTLVGRVASVSVESDRVVSRKGGRRESGACSCYPRMRRCFFRISGHNTGSREVKKRCVFVCVCVCVCMYTILCH